MMMTLMTLMMTLILMPRPPQPSYRQELCEARAEEVHAALQEMQTLLARTQGHKDTCYMRTVFV